MEDVQSRVKCMQQTKFWSFIEVLTNVFVGWVINFLTSVYLLNTLGYNVAITDNFSISVILTVVAMTRGYIIRRLFNQTRKELN